LRVQGDGYTSTKPLNPPPIVVDAPSNATPSQTPCSPTARMKSGRLIYELALSGQVPSRNGWRGAGASAVQA